MRLAYIAGAALLLLAACENRSPEERLHDAKVEAQQAAQADEADRHIVTLVAVAPDGTKLWKYHGYKFADVYFSAGGAEWTERHGKSSHEYDVPAAQ